MDKQVQVGETYEVDDQRAKELLANPLNLVEIVEYSIPQILKEPFKTAKELNNKETVIKKQQIDLIHPIL